MLLMEVGEFNKYEENKRFMEDVAYWLGYLYRALSIKTKICSSDLYGILPLRDVCRYYSMLASYKMESVTDIICEEKQLKQVLEEKRRCYFTFIYWEERGN